MPDYAGVLQEHMKLRNDVTEIIAKHFPSYVGWYEIECAADKLIAYFSRREKHVPLDDKHLTKDDDYGFVEAIKLLYEAGEVSGKARMEGQETRIDQMLYGIALLLESHISP